jgi:thioredoxin-like negative regulator of GroEL
MAPAMDKVAQLLADRCRVLKLDTDEDPEMSGLFRVQGLPTLLFIKQGASGNPAVVHRFEGAAPADYIMELAEHHFFGGPAARDVSGMFE